MNLPDAKHAAVIDRDKQMVTATWPMERVHANFPMADTCAIKETCDLLRHVNWGHEPGLLPLIRSRPSAGTTFSPAGRGRRPSGERFMEGIATRSGARTEYDSPALNQFYLAVPQRGNQPAELQVSSVED